MTARIIEKERLATHRVQVICLDKTSGKSKSITIEDIPMPVVFLEVKKTLRGLE